MRRVYRDVLAACVGFGLLCGEASAGGAAPTPQEDENQALRERVESLEQTVSLLQRQQEAREESEAGMGAQPLIGAGPDGFFLQSADKTFKIRFRGYVQAQGQFFVAGD